ncbi:unnamed protein product [Oikopleura dioica]|uniref:Uncharacterized protein n=1 Tax=Oikopleura dioica TaxID=34765 RepID=E4XFK7_OIKDI|nr:unnamed protein product [Oikopleura dioica]
MSQRRTGILPGRTQAHSKYSAREREKGARDKIREHK